MEICVQIVGKLFHYSFSIFDILHFIALFKNSGKSKVGNSDFRIILHHFEIQLGGPFRNVVRVYPDQKKLLLFLVVHE